jgi:hypothetical protein
MEDIMKNRVIILLTGLVLTLAVSATHAAIIKVEIQATITSIMDQADILGSSVSVGDEITGWYAYDAPALPSEVYGGIALYVFNSAPCGMFFTVGGFNFETDINNIHLEVGVQNNTSNTDAFTLTSKNNISILDMPIDNIHFQLSDDTALAIDNYNLPTESPVLDNWPSMKSLNIFGVKYLNPTDKQSLIINSVVTSAVLVPEPITMVLILTGGIIVRSRKRK